MSTRKQSTEMYRAYEYFESGPGEGTQHIFYLQFHRGQQRIFSIVISKVWGQPPPVPLHRNSTRQVYSSQLEIT